MVLSPRSEHDGRSVVHSLVKQPHNAVPETGDKHIAIRLIGSDCCEIGAGLCRDVLKRA
jgi:hypothetical protein